MASGGARPGAGAKKGQHRVHVKELKDAIEKHVGMPFAEIQAITFLKLFNHFQNDDFIKEYLIFNENMGKRLILEQAQEVNINNSTDMSDDDLKARAAELLAKINGKTD